MRPRDADLLATLKRGVDRQPANVKPILHEVIEAAETMEARPYPQGRACVDRGLEAQGSRLQARHLDLGQIGQGAVALGCIAAAVTGQVEIGIPCVVGGAAGLGSVEITGTRSSPKVQSR